MLINGDQHHKDVEPFILKSAYECTCIWLRKQAVPASYTFSLLTVRDPLDYMNMAQMMSTGINHTVHSPNKVSPRFFIRKFWKLRSNFFGQCEILEFANEKARRNIFWGVYNPFDFLFCVHSPFYFMDNITDMTIPVLTCLSLFLALADLA